MNSKKTKGEPFREFIIHIRYITSYYTKKGGYENKLIRTKKFLKGYESKTVTIKSNRDLKKLFN